LSFSRKEGIRVNKYIEAVVQELAALDAREIVGLGADMLFTSVMRLE
jgi:hypothetical protein